jgi:hypothetical protein
MDTRILIESIMRQTTLLIAQLATSTGTRAPLSHIADQVFLDLAQEIEQQGVSRKVAADMFGLALRSYQRKVGRLRESVSVAEKTLWQAVLEFVKDRGSATRSQVLAAFARDDANDVGAVLSDLVAGSLLYCTGRGVHAAYGLTTSADRKALLDEQASDTLMHLVWFAVATPRGLTREQLALAFPTHGERLDDVLQRLLRDGRVSVEQVAGEARYGTSNVLIPEGSEAGWETAVLDHFGAVCTALASKVRGGGPGSRGGALIGGSTLSFDLCLGHPYEAQVKGLLSRLRSEAQELWRQVSSHNAQHPVPEEQRERVIFYLGQNYIPSDLTNESEP